jgi:hypothetical protein
MRLLTASVRDGADSETDGAIDLRRPQLPTPRSPSVATNSCAGACDEQACTPVSLAFSHNDSPREMVSDRPDPADTVTRPSVH